MSCTDVEGKQTGAESKFEEKLTYKTLGTDSRLYADGRRIASVKDEEDHHLHRDFAVPAAKPDIEMSPK
jgi:hypothetical protein